MKKKKINVPPALRWHGGKKYLSEWLGSMLPKHIHRVHLYAGGLAEARTWPIEGYSLVANDINGLLLNFYRVLQGEETFKAFMRKVAAVPVSRKEWDEADNMMGGAIASGIPVHYGGHAHVDGAVSFFIWNRQSMAGRMDCFSPLTRKRTRGGRNAEVNSWWGAIDGLLEFKAYLDNYVLECDKALKVLKREDGEDSLFYLDPPYVNCDKGEGRTTPDVFHYEMTTKDHEDLMKALTGGLQGKVMLSGYRSELYDDYLTEARGWVSKEKEIDNKAAKGAVKRKMVECCWMNYKPGV